MTREGVLLTFAGIDGAGKSTHARSLARWLKGRGLKAKLVQDRFVTANILRQVVRNLTDGKSSDIFLPIVSADVRALSKAWDRTIVGTKYVKPLVDRGWIVILERYIYCTMAYHSVFGANMQWPKRILAVAPKPDAVILLDLDPKVARERIVKRGQSNFHESEAILTKIRAKFLRIASIAPNFYIVDAYGSKESVSKNIRKIVDSILSKKGIAMRKE